MLDLIIHKLADWNGNEIFILREDLLPLACGGNKVRIALKLIADARLKGATTLVGYGNSRSNLCRVLSMLCASSGLACTIISSSDDDGARVETTNSRIVALSGAKVVTCQKSSSIADVVEGVMTEIVSAGGKPYYINGDKFGKGNEDILASAYEEVAGQILSWQVANDIVFDRIALAVGTGSTYGGLLRGFHKRGQTMRLTGFTIARDLARCATGIANFTNLPTEVFDNALNGGYGKVSREELDFIAAIRRDYALLLDATYAGKALWGLSRIIATDSIRGEKILFIHTGSLPLAIDTLGGGAHG